MDFVSPTTWILSSLNQESFQSLFLSMTQTHSLILWDARLPWVVWEAARRVEIKGFRPWLTRHWRAWLSWEAVNWAVNYSVQVLLRKTLTRIVCEHQPTYQLQEFANGSDIGCQSTFFLCERWAPSLSPGESVCVVVTMNYGSPWKGGIVDYADEKCNHHSNQFWQTLPITIALPCPGGLS